MAEDFVEIIPIINLPDISGADLTTLIPMANPGDPNSKKGDIQLLADIVSSQIGTVTVPDPFFYRVGGPLATDPEPTSISGNRNVPDPALDGLDYSIFKWGVGPLRKGVEWQNDIVGGGWRLLDEDLFDQAMYAAVPKPEISNIISSPDAVARFTAGIALYPADATIGISDYRKLIVINGAKNITLPLCSSYPANIALFLVTSEGPQRQTTINRAGSDVIYSQSGTVTKFYLSNREYAVLITDGTKWYIQSQSDMVFKEPWTSYGWMKGINQVLMDGTSYLRADYPKVFDFIERLDAANPNAVVDGVTWNSNRTLWGLGNGTTTFNVPDFQGTFIRSLNNARSPSLDEDRTAAGTASLQGSLQGHEFEEHSHGVEIESSNDSLGGTGWVTSSNAPGGLPPSDLHTTILPSGGTETRPINVGLNIYFNY